MERAISFERDCMTAARDRVDEVPLGVWTRCSAHPGFRAAGRYWSFTRPA